MSTQPENAEAGETQLPESSPQRDSNFVRVSDFIPNITVDLRYATGDNFTGEVIYSFQDAYLRYGTVKKLMEVSRVLSQQGLYLKIWDAFRPYSAQWKLWEVCPDSTYVSNPETGSSSHCRGRSVDVTLVDSQGQELEMPSQYDDFSALADRDYSDCSAEAAQNAMLLQEAMERFGFTGYQKEWWHFSDTDEYPVDESFDPALISTWYADCQEFISLRAEPSTQAESLTRIPAKEEMTLLGWNGEFALVDYQGQQGYVLGTYIQPLCLPTGNRMLS
ncbi:MAG: M15 family metallopeptidase [Eubacteriales bacterium]|nr:M15 family metallopeptidase [Eubacteriales bacterium]